MISLPPIPTWQGSHPLVAHFPIALLLIAPLFVVMGALWKTEGGFHFFLAALILMGLGTISTFVATASGKADLELVQSDPLVKAAMLQHEELAKTTEIAFTVVTVIFASILFVPRMLNRESNRAVATLLPLVFLIFYATGAIMLANTAHQGGRLVHELGLRSRMQPAYGPQGSTRIDAQSGNRLTAGTP